MQVLGCGTWSSLIVEHGRAAPGKSGLHARGEGERVLALESREGTRASRRVEEVMPGHLFEGNPVGEGTK